MLESLNGGKPIKESRDVDLPLAAAHFFYYAGWADKLEYAFPNRKPQAGRRRGPDHPVELPAADARVEDRARARVRQHRRAEAGGDDAAHGAPLLRRRCARPSFRPASSTSSPATAARAPRSSTTRTSTRSRSPARPRSARRSSRRLAGTGKKLTLELGGKAANIVFDDCGARPGGRGHRQRHLLQPGPRLLRRLAPLRAGVDLRAARREAEAAARDAARRRPARQEHRRRRDQLAHAAREDRGARRRRARTRAPRSTSRRAVCRRRATGSRRPSSRTSRRATASRRRRSSAPC